jgi:hypothetical protein
MELITIWGALVAFFSFSVWGRRLMKKGSSRSSRLVVS